MQRSLDLDAPIAARLRVELADRRRAGAHFDEAWPAAVDVAVGAAVLGDRRAWAQAFIDTEDTWRRAYDREPAPRRLRALANLDDLCEPGGGSGRALAQMVA